MYPYSWMFAYGWTHAGRGLCGSCYHRLTPDERLDYPRTQMSRDELLEEWELLRSEGCTQRQAAERLGMAYATFDRALLRARAAGATA